MRRYVRPKPTPSARGADEGRALKPRRTKQRCLGIKIRGSEDIFHRCENNAWQGHDGYCLDCSRSDSAIRRQKVLAVVLVEDWGRLQAVALGRHDFPKTWPEWAGDEVLALLRRHVWGPLERWRAQQTVRMHQGLAVEAEPADVRAEREKREERNPELKKLRWWEEEEEVSG